jgi:hypothetical protein
MDIPAVPCRCLGLDVRGHGTSLSNYTFNTLPVRKGTQSRQSGFLLIGWLLLYLALRIPGPEVFEHLQAL